MTERSRYYNDVTGRKPTSPEDFLPAPAGATHFDTCALTIYPWHHQIGGQWAYYNTDSGNWKVYDTQSAATVDDFIPYEG